METSCPFQEGQIYRVRRDYSYLNHVFHAGEEVVFRGFAYSPKEGVTRYSFRSVASGETNVWHFFDDQTTEANLHETFQPTNAA
jgi:hypothetical protein